MKYMGSKAKVARYIVPIIQKQIEAPAMRLISSHSAAAAM